MSIVARLLNELKKIPKSVHRWKYYSNQIQKELSVDTFSDVTIKLPYNINIQPLDVFKYPNSDKLIIGIEGIDSDPNFIKHSQSGTKVDVFIDKNDFNNEAKCTIQVPVKASLNVTTPGDITTGSCNGAKLILKSNNGNIIVDKYQGEEFNLITDKGNIILKGPLIATSIKMNISQTGNIETKRLQSLNAELQTNKGDINVDSSYCDKSFFKTQSGNLILSNLHKNCTIRLEEGNLFLKAFDGILDAQIQSGNADIHIAQILEDSLIEIKEEGNLILKISDEFQRKTLIELIAKTYSIKQPINLIPSSNKEKMYLMPKTDEYHTLIAKCKGSSQILSATWEDMFKIPIRQPN